MAGAPRTGPQMDSRPYDVAIAGAGPVGLVTAIGLASAGVRTCLVGPLPEPRDGRTAALMSGSIALLERLGLWSNLSSGAGALRALRIVDATGSLFKPPPVTFQAQEIGLDAFGWNVENARLTESLSEAARHIPGLDWHLDFVDGFTTGDRAELRLRGGETISAALVIATDGRRSQVRQDAGIATREHRYPQSAFTTILRHERDHDDISTEFHTRSGPMTLVPLPGRRSSLVWVTTPRHAERLKAATDDDLGQAVDMACGRLLGQIVADGPRGVLPLSLTSVARCTGERLALAGEALHVLPPIGAQGLNLGFADAAELISLMGEAVATAADPGGAGLLGRYERARSADIRLRSGAVDGLNRSLLAQSWMIDAARGLGLGLLGQIGPLRRAMMRIGLPGATSGGPLSVARAAAGWPRS